MSTRNIRGKDYRLVVLRVVEWDREGRPSKAIIGYDDTPFDLRDDSVSREFMTCYVPRDCTMPKRKDN